MMTFDEHMKIQAQAYLTAVLEATDFNVSQAAKIAGRHRGDFYKLATRHGLTRFKQKQGSWDRPVPGDQRSCDAQ